MTVERQTNPFGTFSRIPITRMGQDFSVVQHNDNDRSYTRELIEDFLNGGNLTRWLTVRWNGSFWKFSYLYLHFCVRRQHAPPVSHLLLLPEEAAGSHPRHGGHYQHREPAGSDEEPAAQRHPPADSGHHHPTPGLQHGDQEGLHLRTRAPHLRGGHVRTSHIQDGWTHLRCLSQLKRCHLSSSIRCPCPDTIL
ncbi:hypothetical protein CEXT_368401 [Caerostris extrusa]|uniref:Uncharacterized protein n=1 Tax=Caerostris extrusa TaxID=172846 RepID=A0AAV4TI83_CAEEX|nr:hypothetical protein CEXT_368401 [Caerostris extrusa]